MIDNKVFTDYLVFFLPSALSQYISETDEGIRSARREERLNLFSLDPDTPVRIESTQTLTSCIVDFILSLYSTFKQPPPVKSSIKLSFHQPQVLRSPRTDHPSAENTSVRPFDEKLGRRFMITCRSLNLMLQSCINETETGPVTNVRNRNTHSLLCFSNFKIHALHYLYCLSFLRVIGEL